MAAAKANQNEFVNRSKMWQIGFFALNNTATNLYMFAMGFISYYATGIAGVAVVAISYILTAMRLFDGITDPIIGYVIDKTNTKFGKFRPYMVLGNIILIITVLALFNLTHLVPEGMRLPFFIIVYGIHIIGYTFQTAVTKAAQTVLTNDPKQRPVFSAFDATYNTILFVGGQFYIASYLQPKHGGFNQGFFTEFNTVVIIAGAIFTVLAVIALWEKDRTEYFGFAEKSVKTTFRDYWPVIKRNRPLQMLVIAAATDKLAGQVLRQPVVPVMFFGILIGDYALSGTVSMITIIPTLILTYIGVGIARNKGLKRTFVGATWGALISFTLLLVLFLVINDPTSISLSNMGFATIAFLVFYTGGYAFMGLTGNLVIPMIADTSDYETHITGRYVPGMIGTIFSFVDKLISSLASTIVGLMLAGIGFTTVFPEVDTPLTTGIFALALFFHIGVPMLGWIASLIAMKFYKLDDKYMAQIQAEIAEVKNVLVEKNQITLPGASGEK
ncbi:glucuronide permease [Mesobacillus campisalis]|uniref:Glucuronide permease n=1 Tax=Mesobacillus campisalis TaxID=1408103 RepID=A0A0M2SSG1_9BACI|nr:MFS transporter [Mesobacillus campisalis]KKK37514.1 glucuronide permease [Mesobacillus campisalis]